MIDKALKQKRALVIDEVKTICRSLGYVTNGQAWDIADVIIAVQSGKESINDAVARIEKEKEEQD